MGRLGMPELLCVGIIVLLLFGAKRLPELGRSAGQTLTAFKRGLREATPTIEEPEVRG
jgi:sec-independent protein translocase protein TatA